MRAIRKDKAAVGLTFHNDQPKPAPKEDEVLVRVHASTVTRGDAMGVRSAEYRFTRVFTRIRRPRRNRYRLVKPALHQCLH